jgi:hypothetical protein
MLNAFFLLIVLFWAGETGSGATHGPDATLGPYGPLRDWPPKTSDDAVDQGFPGAPVREAPRVEGGLVDPITGEALAPLRHEELPRDPAPDK